MKGLAFDEMIEKAEQNITELKDMQEMYGKIPDVYMTS